MQHLIINSKEVSLPDSWAEVTWKQGYELSLLGEKDIPPNRIIFHVVSICTGFAPTFWRDFEDLPQFAAIANRLSWAYDQEKAAKEIEGMKRAKWDKIERDGKEYRMPEDVGGLTAAQFIDAQQVLSGMQIAQKEEKEEKISIESFLDGKKHLFCIYFQALIDGEYDYGKAAEMNVDEIPFISVVKWGDFFLLRLIGSTRGTQAIPSRLATQIRKLLPGFQN